MFTGIIRNKSKIINLKLNKSPLKSVLKINNPFTKQFNIGDSISVNGVCLTVVSFDKSEIVFELLDETLKLTNLEYFFENKLPVNLERSLKYGEENHGSEVTAHVDMTVDFIKNDGEIYYFQNNSKLHKFLQEKNYIVLNGVCLTLVSVTNEYFTVCLIPQTLSETNFQFLSSGQPVNVEIDKTARVIVNYLENLNLLK